jgi:hypothetical protein
MAEAREDSSARHESSHSLFQEVRDVMPWTGGELSIMPDRLVITHPSYVTNISPQFRKGVTLCPPNGAFQPAVRAVPARQACAGNGVSN